MPHSDNKHQKTPLNFNSFFSLVAGAGASGAIELGIFFPFDSAAKRLMNEEKQRAKSGNPIKQGQVSLKQIIFLDAHDKGISAQCRSMYKGFSLGVGYKVSQRVIKFAGQPLIAEPLHHYCGKHFQILFGKNASIAEQAAAGMITGMIEVPFLQPVDALKVRSQTKNQTYKFIQSIKTEGLDLYRGSGVTILRNLIGSAGLWGTNAYLKSKLQQGDSKKKLTLAENALTSSTASIISVIVSHPADVIRTRVISSEEKPTPSACSTFVNTLKKSGPREFTKGLPTKVVTIFPKVAFTMTLVPYMTDFFEKNVLRRPAQPELSEKNHAPSWRAGK